MKRKVAVEMICVGVKGQSTETHRVDVNPQRFSSVYGLQAVNEKKRLSRFTC